MPDHSEAQTSPPVRIVRVAVSGRRAIDFVIDGRPATALEGDSVLVALLASGAIVRRNEFDGSARAGFCLMGACQDCWVWTADGRRLRACTTLISPGLHVSSRAPRSVSDHD